MNETRNGLTAEKMPVDGNGRSKIVSRQRFIHACTSTSTRTNVRSVRRGYWRLTWLLRRTRHDVFGAYRAAQRRRRVTVGRENVRVDGFERIDRARKNRGDGSDTYSAGPRARSTTTAYVFIFKTFFSRLKRRYAG